MLSGKPSYSRLQKRPPYRAGLGNGSNRDDPEVEDSAGTGISGLRSKLLFRMRPHFRRVQLSRFIIVCTLSLLLLLCAGAVAIWYLFMYSPPLVWRVPNVCAYKRSLFSPEESRRIPEGKYFIAANYHDNEHVLPHLLNQMLAATSIIGYQNVFVSIFESGSTDLSKEWLQHFGEVLEARGVRHNIELSLLTKAEAEPRIAFLARVRNLALKPLYQGEFKADYVIFLNDVVMCAEDMVRLAQRAAQPDVGMACGMDFEFSSRPYSTEMTFYDTWVTLDMAGDFLSPHYPYFSRERDQRKLREAKPIPVYSCWNGMIALKAKPFYEGLRFRAAASGECRASECTLFCKDLWNAGHGNIVIDPAVALSYDHAAASHLAVEPPAGVGNFKHKGDEIIVFDEPKPQDFICHGISGTGNHPNEAQYRALTAIGPS